MQRVAVKIALGTQVVTVIEIEIEIGIETGIEMVALILEDVIIVEKMVIGLEIAQMRVAEIDALTVVAQDTWLVNAKKKGEFVITHTVEAAALVVDPTLDLDLVQDQTQGLALDQNHAIDQDPETETLAEDAHPNHHQDLHEEVHHHANLDLLVVLHLLQMATTMEMKEKGHHLLEATDHVPHHLQRIEILQENLLLVLLNYYHHQTIEFILQLAVC